MSSAENGGGGTSIKRIERASPDDLEPSRAHVRQTHEPPGDGFVSNIDSVGIINAVHGRYENGELRLYDGVRRAKAAAELGIEEIPVIVREISYAEALELSNTLNPEIDSANNKSVTEGDRDAALDQAAHLSDKDRDELERDLGLLSEADRFMREFESEPGVGSGTAETLADAGVTVDDIRGDDPVPLQQISGIGETTANAVRSAVSKPAPEDNPTVVTHDEKWEDA